MGFDERFLRMWRYYLSYCEGGFRSGRVDVRQIVLARDRTSRSGGYLRDPGPIVVFGGNGSSIATHGGPSGQHP